MKQIASVFIGLLFAVVILQAKAAEKLGDEIYYSITPAFVVSLLDERQRKKYIQVRLDLTVDSYDTVDNVKNNMPLVRDRVITLLAKQSLQELRTMKAKQKLMKDAVSTINGALSESGKPAGVKSVLLTDFIVE